MSAGWTVKFGLGLTAAGSAGIGASTASHAGVPVVRGRNVRRMGLPIQSKMMARVANASMISTNTKKAATVDIAECVDCTASGPGSGGRGAR